jgi:hypothetical protein
LPTVESPQCPPFSDSPPRHTWQLTTYAYGHGQMSCGRDMGGGKKNGGGGGKTHNRVAHRIRQSFADISHRICHSAQDVCVVVSFLIAVVVKIGMNETLGWIVVLFTYYGQTHRPRAVCSSGFVEEGERKQQRQRV